MLSRTASDLYWLSRLVERAENTARMLDVAWNLSMMPFVANPRDEMMAPLMISGSHELYMSRHDDVQVREVLHFFTLDQDNPGSIFNCLRLARENGHAVRGKITAEMWESINSTWLELKEIRRGGLDQYGASAFFDWVKMSWRIPSARNIWRSYETVDSTQHRIPLFRASAAQYAVSAADAASIGTAAYSALASGHAGAGQRGLRWLR